MRQPAGQVTVAAAIAMVVATLAPSAPARALAPTPVFAPYLNYDVGLGHSVAVGDFTGDGRTDVVLTTEDHDPITNPDEESLWLFVQGPDGWFSRVESFPIELGWRPQAGVAAGDLDGDGRTDAAVATGTAVQLFLQRGGTLAPGPSIPFDGAFQVEVADLDGDGRTDLVVAAQSGVAVLYGSGGGRFDPPVTVASGQIEVEVADVTGDGRLDVVGCLAEDVLVLAQEGGRTFAEPASYRPAVRCEGLAVGDLTGDGRADVAVVGGDNRPSSRVNVFAQQPDGTLAAPAGYATLDIPRPAEVGDVNGDGRGDLVVVHPGWERVGVHAQAPDGSLDPERTYFVPYANHPAPKALDLGDVNGDGRTDIVIPDDLRGLVVLWGQPAAPSTTTSSSMLPTTTPTTPPPGSPPAIFDNGQRYEVGSSGESVATGDFNGDGRTDVALSTTYGADPDSEYKVFVFYQGPGGSLERVVRFQADEAGSDVFELAAGDQDGDGRDDLVLRSRHGIDLFLQRNGTFADRRYLELPYGTRVRMADLDGDGRSDLIMAGGPGIAVYRSLGPASFAPATTVSAAYHSQLAVGDVTGDGRLDLVTTDPFAGSSAALVFAQAPDGTFAGPVRHATGGHTAGALAVGDLTGDGRPDIAVADTIGDYLSIERVKVLAQTPGGGFAAPVTYAADQPRHLEVADVDGDGRGDLVTVRNWTQVGVLLQRPDGTLAPEQVTETSFSTFTSLNVAAVADVTADGRPDVVVADHAGGLTVVRNVTTATPPAVPTTTTTPPSPPPSPPIHAVPSSRWAQPGTGPLDGLGSWVAVAADPAAGPGQLPPSWLFGHAFGFEAGSALGVVGLVADPAGRFALLHVVGPDGTPHTAAVPFAWEAGRFYLPVVHRLGPGVWGAWVYDHGAGTWVAVGQVALPTSWGGLAPTSSTFAAWYGPPAAACSAYPRADVLFHPPTGFAAATTSVATLSAMAAGEGDCPAQASVDQGVWARYRLGSEGRA